jgi:hypothetical protein
MSFNIHLGARRLIVAVQIAHVSTYASASVVVVGVSNVTLRWYSAQLHHFSLRRLPINDDHDYSSRAQPCSQTSIIPRFMGPGLCPLRAMLQSANAPEPFGQHPSKCDVLQTEVGLLDAARSVCADAVPHTKRGLVLQLARAGGG